MIQRLAVSFLCYILIVMPNLGWGQNGMIVFQSDFGLKDGAVAAMKGVALTVAPDLKLYDLTHEIPAYNIWEAAYRLEQTISYWPAGTVFVSVVDPGVGTDRRSVVVKTKSGHFIVTPDNGTLTLIAASLGIEERRQIDEAVNRRQHSEGSYTFHGRDVYAYTAARLASGRIRFEEVGQPLDLRVVAIPYVKAELDGRLIRGTIEILDVQYGNVWTNIPAGYFDSLGIKKGRVLDVKIFHHQKQLYHAFPPYEATFGAVGIGKPVVYLNSLMKVAIALNQKNFARTFAIGSGNDWHIELRPVQ